MTFINRPKPNVNYRNVAFPTPPATATVNTASQLIVPENNDRIGLIIVNLSTTNNVYLALGHDAMVNSGVTLLPNLGWKMDEFTFSVAAINAIADTAGVPVSIQEFTM